MNELFQQIPMEDLAALAFFIICWFGYTYLTATETYHKRSLLAITNGFRLRWMQEMLKRDNRTMDSIMVGNLLRSITFFANTTIFILLGLMTMLGYGDRASSILATIPFAAHTTGFMWEIKIFLLIMIFIYAFFKYTWSLRQYNYAGIYVGAAPPSRDVEAHAEFASKAAYLISNAAKHFNNGLRAYYFGLAALAWFIHPGLFASATAIVLYELYRREYRSATLKNLAQ